MPTLYIVRGLPGSGKSTYVYNNLNEDVFLYEADDFFSSQYGYKFDPKFLKNAHEMCYQNVVCSLFHGCNVAVANTFTTRWEMLRYLSLTEIFPDLKIKIIEMKTQYTSVHDVPEETVQKMKNRWEELNSSKFDIEIIE